MPGLEVKNVGSPEEVRQMSDDKGEVDVVTVDGHAVLSGEFRPGWRWSQHVKPIVGGDSCQAPHLLYCISGRMGVVMDDGTEAEVGPGDVASIAPGHDAWVIGDEPFRSIDFGGYGQYARRT
jgi:quercetin dioxygenase-like cupin family protein